VPASVTDQWSIGGPGQKSQKRLAEMLSAADIAEDPAVKANALKDAQTYFVQHGGTPEDWDSTQRLMLTPAYLKAAGLPSREESVISHAKMQEELNKTWLSNNPQFRDTKDKENMLGFASEFAMRILKRPLNTLDAKRPDDIPQIEAAKSYADLQTVKARQQEDIRKAAQETEKQQAMLGREKDLAKYKADLAKETGPKWNETQAKTALATINTADTAMSESRAMRGTLQRLQDKGLLPSDASPGAGVWSDIKQAWNYNDPDVRFLKNMILPYFIGLVDRGLNDEKGTRAMAMFTKQIELVTKSPTQEGLGRLFDLSEYMFYNKATKSLSLHERAAGRMDPAVLDEERARYRELFPKPIPDPSALMGGQGPLGGGANLDSLFPAKR